MTLLKNINKSYEITNMQFKIPHSNNK